MVLKSKSIIEIQYYSNSNMELFSLVAPGPHFENHVWLLLKLILWDIVNMLNA